MSRGCLLHVGMHKTGTTSIQQSLAGFADEQFVYGDVDRHPNHTRAVFSLLQTQGQDRPHRGPARVTHPRPPGRVSLMKTSRY